LCPSVFQVQGPDDIRPEWVKHALTVGLTAGTSTPDHVIAAVEQRLEQIASAATGRAPVLAANA
jgi:4-hydroxy-3-methylbut-2-enyl diphosphate reductase IspH